MTRGNRQALAVCAAVLLALCPACKKRGGELADGVTVLPVPGAVDENGWPRYELAAEGFAVSLPPDWRQLDLAPEKFQAVYDEMTAKNPEFAPLLRGVREQAGRGVKFFGFDPATAGTGLATNVNVMRQPVPGVTLDAAVADTLRAMEGLPDVAKPVAHERLTLRAGECERLRYRLTMTAPTGQRATLALTQYVAVSGGNLYVMTMGILPHREAEYAGVFEGVGRSFRILK
jgi:hypothetical protein